MINAMMETAEDSLPGFPRNTGEVQDWHGADALVNRWAQLDEGEFEEAVGNLSLAQISSMLPFIQGVVREHSDRANYARKLEERVRATTAGVADSARISEATHPTEGVR